MADDFGPTTCNERKELDFDAVADMSPGPSTGTTDVAAAASAMVLYKPLLSLHTDAIAV